MLADGESSVSLSWSSVESYGLFECDEDEPVAVGMLDDDVPEGATPSLSLSLPAVCCEANDDEVLVGRRRPPSRPLAALSLELALKLEP